MIVVWITNLFENTYRHCVYWSSLVNVLLICFKRKTTLLCEPLSTWVLRKFQLNQSFIILRLMPCLLELISFFISTRPRWFNTNNVITLSSAHVTNLTVNRSVGICASIPEENNLALIFDHMLYDCIGDCGYLWNFEWQHTFANTKET